MGKGRKHYSEEFKIKVIQAATSGTRWKTISTQYGISESTINNWIKEKRHQQEKKQTIITIQKNLTYVQLLGLYSLLTGRKDRPPKDILENWRRQITRYTRRIL
jgi:hypothetical protein